MDYIEIACYCRICISDFNDTYIPNACFVRFRNAVIESIRAGFYSRFSRLLLPSDIADIDLSMWRAWTENLWKYLVTLSLRHIDFKWICISWSRSKDELDICDEIFNTCYHRWWIEIWLMKDDNSYCWIDFQIEPIKFFQMHDCSEEIDFHFSMCNIIERTWHDDWFFLVRLVIQTLVRSSLLDWKQIDDAVLCPSIQSSCDRQNMLSYKSRKILHGVILATNSCESCSHI